MSGDSKERNSSNVSSSNDSSSLQTLVDAKKKINEIFLDIQDYVNASISFVTIKDNEGLLLPEKCNNVESYATKVRGIREVLARDHMKFVFFGRTSNGKSTVINALLREEILPCGIGHTTNCFLQVAGADRSYVILEDSEEERDVNSVAQLGNALSVERQRENSLVRVFWHRDKCILLKNDVVLVDSPGIDVTPNQDEWIDKYCLDADVFVFVANAESTITIAEKSFFHKVLQKLSKPNVFILYNRWEASVSEVKFSNQVRAQHMERAVDFLVKEVKLCSSEEARERIFFVSAKEALQARLPEEKGKPHRFAEGFQERYFEFQYFERKLEECISKSGARTKFSQHHQGGKMIAYDVQSIMETVCDRCHHVKEGELCRVKNELHENLSMTKNQLELLTHLMKCKIQHVKKKVEEKMSRALTVEIHQLYALVNAFDTPFHPEPIVLNVYKSKLRHHVEKQLETHLKSKLSNVLSLDVEKTQIEMIDVMTQLMPPNTKYIHKIAKPRKPFDVLTQLNWGRLSADFKENLEFRFSRRIEPLMHSITESSKKALKQLTAHTPFGKGKQTFMISKDWLVARKVLLSSFGDQATLGGAMVAGFMFKTCGLSLIMTTGAFLSGMYMYEWLNWTRKAKEREFKRQYVAHVSQQLGQFANKSSSRCSYHVERELSSTLDRLCQLVLCAADDMQRKIKRLDTKIEKVEETCSIAQVLRDKAYCLINELDLFQEAYLVNMN